MYKPSMRLRTYQFELIRRALALGWKGAELNTTARRHFFFEGPVELSVHWFNNDFPQFTVGNTSTSSEAQAISMLRAVALCQ